MQARPMCASTCTTPFVRFSPRPYSHETVQPDIRLPAVCMMEEKSSRSGSAITDEERVRRGTAAVVATVRAWMRSLEAARGTQPAGTRQPPLGDDVSAVSTAILTTADAVPLIARAVEAAETVAAGASGGEKKAIVVAAINELRRSAAPAEAAVLDLAAGQAEGAVATLVAWARGDTEVNAEARRDAAQVVGATASCCFALLRLAGRGRQPGRGGRGRREENPRI